MSKQIMYKSLRKAANFAMIFALICGIIIQYPNGNVKADSIEDLQDQITQIEQENAEREQQLAQLADDKDKQQEYADLAYEQLLSAKELVDSLNNKVALKQLDIDNAQAEIDELDKQIVDKELEIEKKNKEIDKLNEDNKDNLLKFAEIVKAMYVSGNTDMLAILSGASDFYDLMVRTEIISNISDQNMKFMQDLMDSINSLNQKKTQLDKDIKQIETDKQVIVDKKAKLEEEKLSLADDVAASEEQSNEYSSQYNKYSSAINNLAEKEQQITYQIQASAEEISSYEDKIQEMIAAQLNPDKDYVEGEWIWPVPGRTYISCGYGWDADFGRDHKGIDVGDSGILGTSILAAKSGTVIVAENYYIPGYSYGKYIVIDHGGGYTTTYAHCSEVYVGVGQEVSQGDAIGAVGNTGYSTGPHLHFEVRINEIPQDPFSYVTPY